MHDLLKNLLEDTGLVDTYPAADLTTARSELSELAATLADGIAESETPDDDVAALEDLAGLADAIDARLATIAEADEARKAKVADLAARFTPPSDDDPLDEAVADDETDTPVEDPELEPVTASAETDKPVVKPSLKQIAKRIPADQKPRQDSRPALTAAVDGRDDRIVDTADFGELALRTWEHLKGTKPERQAHYPVATLDTKRARRYQIPQGASVEQVGAVFDQLRKDMQYKGVDALTASGGFCAPATPVYDFFSISSEDGLIQLPTVGAPRGRITYPVSESYNTIRTTANWKNAVGGDKYTATEDAAGASKNQYSPECPSTSTCAVDAYPLILKWSNFNQLFYPEHVAHVTAESMRAHAHLVNESLISDIVAGATVVGGGNPGGGSIVNLSQVLSFEAQKYREKYRMPKGAVLDVVLPHWVEDALVADHRARNGTTDYAAGAVAGLFSDIGLRVQYVYDWQGISDGAFGGYPAVVDVLMWAPGTIVRLDGGSLDLGVVRDSTLNLTNDFQTFVETFEGICKPGHEALLINDVTVCPTGATSTQKDISCAVGS